MGYMKINKNLLFITSMILISILLFGFYYGINQSGTQVLITLNGEEYGSYDLNEDQTIRIDLEDGEYNIIEIKDGTVDMIESTCPNQICVNTMPITKDQIGVIVCLPHDLTVEIKE